MVEAETQAIRDGEHVELAEAAASDAGYEGPFFCADHNEAVDILDRLRILVENGAETSEQATVNEIS